MSDVHLFHTDDGGEMRFINGRVELDHGAATAAYISLFGGNEDDAGTAATERQQWWGNLLDTDRARHVRSETQHLLRSLPAISANLPRIEDAVRRDLAWMEEAIGADVDASASIPALNRIQMDTTIEIDGAKTELQIVEPWGTE